LHFSIQGELPQIEKAEARALIFHVLASQICDSDERPGRLGPALRHMNGNIWRGRAQRDEGRQHRLVELDLL
jgi:hypothetical protein